MHGHMHVHLHLSRCIHGSTSLQVQRHIHTNLPINRPRCTYPCMHAQCADVHIYTCTSVHVHTCTHVHMFTCTQFVNRNLHRGQDVHITVYMCSCTCMQACQCVTWDGACRLRSHHEPVRRCHHEPVRRCHRHQSCAS